MPASSLLDILLVEDDPGDIRLIKEMLREAPMRTNVSAAKDGMQALAWLKRTGSFAHAPRPDLVLLDLNLPKLNGQDVLEEMKHDAELSQIPVVVLTTSSREQDVATTLSGGAATYLMKPLDLDTFLLALERLGPPTHSA